MPQPDLLLIEDDEAIAELIVWHFAREGFSVRQTPDGEQALVLVEERVPDIVLLDWMIESLPGIAVPSLVIVGEDDTPFIAASGYMAAKIPGARLVTIPKAGHAANIDQPAAFNAAVLEFLEGAGLTAA